MADELSKKTIQAWRNFAMTPAFKDGVEYLRRFHKPTNDRSSVPMMIESAIGRTAYDKALEDLEDVLMEFPKGDQRADDDRPLETI